MKDFIEFVRKQGVVGLAVGFVLGGSVTKVVTALVEDIIYPVLNVVFGVKGDLAAFSLNVGVVHIKYGHFLSVMLDFIIIAFVVYYVVKGLGFEKLDKK